MSTSSKRSIAESSGDGAEKAGAVADFTSDFLFVTNRTVQLENDDDDPSKAIHNKSILEVLSDQPADPTSNLRVGRAWNVMTGREPENSTRWNCDIFEDQSDKNQRKSDEPTEQTKQAIQKIVEIGKPIVLAVHGYNNKATTPFQAASKIRRKYNCTVIPFLWPTDGRTLGYAKDRQDARISAEAFLRFLVKVNACMNEEGRVEPSNKKQKTGPETSQSAPTKPKVMLICHSMGNYVLENALKFGGQAAGKDLLGIGAKNKESTKSFLQHILLVAADVDSDGHAKWVGQLKPKSKVFVFINKDDDALKVSNYFAGLLTGKDNPVRLGQTLDHIQPTYDRIYVHVVVRGRGFDPLHFLELEHSYHADGEARIKEFFESVIQDREQWSTPPAFLPRYYEVEGYSDE